MPREDSKAATILLSPLGTSTSGVLCREGIQMAVRPWTPKSGTTRRLERWGMGLCGAQPAGARHWWPGGRRLGGVQPARTAHQTGGGRPEDDTADKDEDDTVDKGFFDEEGF